MQQRNPTKQRPQLHFNLLTQNHKQIIITIGRVSLSISHFLLFFLFRSIQIYVLQFCCSLKIYFFYLIALRLLVKASEKNCFLLIESVVLRRSQECKYMWVYQRCYNRTIEETKKQFIFNVLFFLCKRLSTRYIHWIVCNCIYHVVLVTRFSFDINKEYFSSA